MTLGIGLGVRPAGSVSSPTVPVTALLAEDGTALLAEDGTTLLPE